MPPAPDSQSLTRLLVSAGALMVVAAFIVPGLILRDTGVLTISQEDLRHLTPIAQQEIERRQGIAQDAGEIALIAGVVLFIFGAGLIALGIPRLNRLEQGDEERRKMERDKLRGELRPQSVEEKRERIQEDLAEDEAEEGSESALVTKDKTPVSPAPTSHDSPMARAMLEALQVERAVLARVEKIAPPRYEFESQVIVGGKPRLALDGLLISKVDQLPDIVIEIKYSRGGNVGLSKRIADAKEQLLRYLARFRRSSVGWLIIVVTEEPSTRRKKELEEFLAETADVLRLSIVPVQDLDQLELPV